MSGSDKSGPLQRRVTEGKLDDVKFVPREKCRILKNLILISFAFMMHFTAFQGICNIQSSINREYGTPSLAIIYGSMLFFGLFLPPIIIRCIGCKMTMALTFFAYFPYVLAQMHFTIYTMIPSAILVGLGAGTLWCAKCTYLSIMADYYSELTGIASDVIRVRFFGIFVMIFQLCQVWGNLISSEVFSMWSPPHETHLNVSHICGPEFCVSNSHEANNTNLVRPSDTKIMIVVGAYISCMVPAMIIICLGVDSLKMFGEKERDEQAGSSAQLIVSVLGLWIEPKQLMLIPIVIWNGVRQAFVVADYTEEYVSCTWGIEHIGFVMICYGISNSVSAISSGWLVKVVGRVPLVCAAFLLEIGLCVYMIYWHQHSEEYINFFVLSGLWGVCDGVWLVQTNALNGIIFPGREEAAYSNFRVWQALGFAVSFSYSNLLCNIIKLYIVIGLLCVGMVGYLQVERLEMKKKSKIIMNKYSTYRHFKI